MKLKHLLSLDVKRRMKNLALDLEVVRLSAVLKKRKRNRIFLERTKDKRLKLLSVK